MMMRTMRMTAMMTTMMIPTTRRLEDPEDAVFTFLVGASVCSSACDWSKVRMKASHWSEVRNKASDWSILTSTMCGSS